MTLMASARRLLGSGKTPGDIVPVPSILPYTHLLVVYSGNGNTQGNVPIDPLQYVAGNTVTVQGNVWGLGACWLLLQRMEHAGQRRRHGLRLRGNVHLLRPYHAICSVAIDDQAHLSPPTLSSEACIAEAERAIAYTEGTGCGEKRAAEMTKDETWRAER